MFNTADRIYVYKRTFDDLSSRGFLEEFALSNHRLCPGTLSNGDLGHQTAKFVNEALKTRRLAGSARRLEWCRPENNGR